MLGLHQLFSEYLYSIIITMNLFLVIHRHHILTGFQAR